MKYSKRIGTDSNWTFSGNTELYEFAIAILEGTPVFVGDVVYHILHGHSVEITENHVGCLVLDKATWTPPQKKQTFMLNGEELPCPLNITTKYGLDINGHRFHFDSQNDKNYVANKIRDILHEAGDKA